MVVLPLETTWVTWAGSSKHVHVPWRLTQWDGCTDPSCCWSWLRFLVLGGFMTEPRSKPDCCPVVEFCPKAKTLGGNSRGVRVDTQDELVGAS